MPVTTVRKIEFVDFLELRLRDEYRLVPNDVTMITLAGLKGEPFRVAVKSPEGWGVRFNPAEGKGNPFMVACYRAEPGKSILNLTGYADVPAFLQTIIDEFMALSPDYQLEIRLAPE